MDIREGRGGGGRLRRRRPAAAALFVAGCVVVTKKTDPGSPEPPCSAVGRYKYILPPLGFYLIQGHINHRHTTIALALLSLYTRERKINYVVETDEACSLSLCLLQCCVVREPPSNVR